MRMKLLACNSGETDVTGVAISSIVPNGIAFPSATDGATCTTGGCGGGATLSWDLDSIGAHRCRTVHVSFSVSAGTIDGTDISTTFQMEVDGGGTVSDTLTFTVDSAFALVTEISGDKDPVAGGDVINYTVVFGNRSLANVLNGSLTAIVPLGTTLLSVEDGGSEASGIITWPLGTISAGETGQRRFSVTVDEAAVDGTAILAQANAVGTGEASQATEATAVVSTETLHAYVSANSFPVPSGARVLYDLTICNSGLVEATGLDVQALMPNGLAFPVAADAGAGCTTGGCGAGGRLFWTLEDALPAGRCRTLQVSYAISANNGDIYRPSFRVTADGGASAWASYTGTVDTARRFLLVLDEDRDPVAGGEPLTYTLTYGNFSAENGLNSTLRAWVPEGTTVSSIDGGGVEAGGVITWTLGTVRAGESGQRRFTVTVDGETPDGTALDAVAELDLDNGGTFVAGASQTTMVNSEASLTIVMAAQSDEIRFQERVLYDMTICNPGIDDAIGLVLNGIQPDGLAFPVTVDGATCSTGGCGGGGLLTWNLGDLGAGRCRTIPLSNMDNFNSDASPIGFALRVQADNRQQAIAARPVVGERTPELALGLVDDRDPVTAGDDVTYTIAASNRGEENVTGTVLRFFVPRGTTLVSASDAGSETSGVITWDLGTMAPGDAVQRKVVVTVDELTADGSSVLAEADLAGGSTEKFDARATQATSVVSAETLTLDLIPHFEPQRVNDSLYLDIVMCNRGLADATGVSIEMIVPNGLAFARIPEVTSATCSTGGCGGGALITIPVGTLLAGRCRTLAMTELVNGGVDGELIRPIARMKADGGSLVTAGRVIAVNSAQPLTSFIEQSGAVAQTTGETFKANFGNRSDSTFSNGQLRIAIPAGATVTAASTGAVIDGNELSWNLCPMSAGQSGEYTYSVSLADAATLPNGTALITEAQFSALDGNPPASHAAAATEVHDSAPLLPVSIVTAPADIAKAGDLVTYELEVCNNGAGQASGVEVRMFVPKGMAVSALNDGGTNVNGEILWNIDAINGGECATVSGVLAVASGGNYVGDGTVFFASARVTIDGGEASNSTHALRACSTTLASCTLKPPPPCAAPQSRACNRTASDALAILRTAVNLRECPLCECDIDGNGNITASDALGTLRFSVGQAVPLRCPACLPEP